MERVVQDSLERRGEVLIDGARVTPAAEAEGLAWEKSLPMNLL